MSHRRRRIRNRRESKEPNRWLVALQILVFAGALLFLYAFGEIIATNASNIVSGLTGQPPSGAAGSEADASSPPPLETPDEPSRK